MYDLVLKTGSFSTELSAAGCAVVCAVPCAEALTVTRAGSRTASSLREYFITISSLSVAEPDHYTRRFFAPSAPHVLDIQEVRLKPDTTDEHRIEGAAGG